VKSGNLHRLFGALFFEERFEEVASMEVESMSKAEDLVWLEEAFAKGVIDELAAACCLAGCSEEDVKINDVHPSKLHPSDILTPAASKLYEIIISWPNTERRKPLLWYLEQAVIREAPYVKYDLLFSKCRESAYRKKTCIDKYPELARKLGLKKINSLNAAPASNEKILEYATSAAANHYKETKIVLSQHKVAPLIKKRLEKDNLYYAEASIRNMLRGWNFVPPAESR
jgi:hypothetical protein